MRVISTVVIARRLIRTVTKAVKKLDEKGELVINLFVSEGVFRKKLLTTNLIVLVGVVKTYIAVAETCPFFLREKIRKGVFREGKD